MASYALPDLPERPFRMYLTDKTLGPKPVNTAEAVVGTFNFANEDLLVLDLRRLFGQPYQTHKPVTLVVVTFQKVSYGLVVDILEDAFLFQGEVKERQPDISKDLDLPHAAFDYVSSVASGKAAGVTKVIYVLNLEALLSPGTLYTNLTRRGG